MLTPHKIPQNLFHVRVIQNRPIAQNQWSLWVKSEDEPLPPFELGNFCMLTLPDLLDPLTPRPLAVAAEKDGAYQFIYRTHGKFTQLLSTISQGLRLSVLGPLGRGISRNHFDQGQHIFLAGGVGFASLLPLMLQLVSKNRGDAGRCYYGVRTELEQIRSCPLPLHMASDDGSIGFKGRLHDLLREEKSWSQADWFYVCGPSLMMKAVYDLLPPERTFYFLEEAMGCGVGICVGCIVPIVGEDQKVRNLRSCIEGPIFRGSQLSAWRAR